MKNLASELNMSTNINIAPNDAVQVGDCLLGALETLCVDTEYEAVDGYDVLSDYMESVMDDDPCFIWLD